MKGEADILEEIRDGLMVAAGDDFDWRYGLVAPACESPIERLFAAMMIGAFTILGRRAIFFSPLPFDEGKLPSAYLGGIMAFPQSSIGPYRVDFLFVEFEGKPKPTGVARKIVVECDGHDFHERTKEQAARDRSRDRWMTEHDIPVLRFTGSEIWNEGPKIIEQMSRILYPKAGGA